MVHHHLDHSACLAGNCSRDVWVTPLEFDGEDIVPVRPAEVEGFDAR
jgi:hypothetical protein